MYLATYNSWLRTKIKTQIATPLKYQSILYKQLSKYTNNYKHNTDMHVDLVATINLAFKDIILNSCLNTGMTL